MSTKIFLVEFQDEVEATLAYLEGCDPPLSDFSIIGLEPSVRAFVKSKGVVCADTLAYFDNESHGRVLQKSEDLIQLIERELILDLGDDIKEAYRAAFVFYGRSYLHLMLKKIELLDRIRQVHPGSTLVICPDPDSTRRQVSPFLQPTDRFTESLGRKFCRQYGTSLESIPPVSTSPATATAGSNGQVKQGGILDWLIARCYTLTLRMQSRSSSVLASTFKYNLDSLVRSINDRFPETKPIVLRLGRTHRRKELRYALSWLCRAALGRESNGHLRTIPLELIGDSLWGKGRASTRKDIERNVAGLLMRTENQFVYRGVSFLDEFRSKVNGDLIPYLLTLYKLAQAQASILKTLRPSLVLSPFSAQMFHSLGELCEVNHIPALVIPQKTLVAPKNKLEAIEESHIGRAQINNEYSFAAAQTPLALSYMQHVNYTGQIIPTGPLIFSKVTPARRQQLRDRFFAEMGGAGRIAVHAPTSKTRRSSRLHVVETVDEVLSSMADMAESVAALEDTYLVLRIHPGDAITRSDVETLIDLPSNVTISEHGPFADVLALADVLVSYSSTCVEEALQNGIPVILYDRWERYNHLDAPPVRNGVPDGLSPAYYVSSKAHLGQTLRWVLDAHASAPEIPPSLRAKYVFDQDLNQRFYDFVRPLVVQKR